MDWITSSPAGTLPAQSTHSSHQLRVMESIDSYHVLRSVSVLHMMCDQVGLYMMCDQVGLHMMCDQVGLHMMCDQVGLPHPITHLYLAAASVLQAIQLTK